MSGKLESVIIVGTLFLILTSSYGQSSALPDLQSSTNTIFAAWPSPSFPALKNCSSTDVVCIIGVANAAAAYPGIALFYGFSLVYSLATRINAMMAMFQIFLFGGAFQSGSVPVLGIIMTMLIFLGLIEVLRIARGSSSGT